MDGLIRRSAPISALIIATLAPAPDPGSLPPRPARDATRPAATSPAPAANPGTRRGDTIRLRPGGPAPATLVRWRGSGGWGTGTRYQRLYDPARVTTLEGRLLRLEEVRPYAGMGPGLQAVVETDRGTLRAHLGPRWFVEQQDATLRAGGRVVVTGALASLAGREVIIASEVRARGRVLKLRDGLGLPFWSWARHPQPPEAEE